MGGDFNAAYDIWLAAPPAPTSAYSDALDAFVMVWLYQPSGRSPIGSVKASNKSIGGSSYNVWAGPRNSGTNPNRPVISYVLTSATYEQDLRPQTHPRRRGRERDHLRRLRDPDSAGS